MLRIAVALLCMLFAGVALPAQEEDLPPTLRPDRDPLFERSEDSFTTYLLEAGLTNLRPWQVNQTLFSNGAGFSQFTTLGFAESNFSNGTAEGFNPGNDISLGLHWFLAEEIKTIRPSDSAQMSYRLKGWELMTSLYAIDWIRSDHVALITGIGTYWGNLKLHSENSTANTGRQLYKNPFVAPMVRAELRFNIGVISFGGRWSYRHDITHDNWKRFDDNMERLPGYKFREMQYMVFLGLRIED